MLIADYTILIILIAVFVVLAVKSCDTSNMAIIISAWITNTAISSGRRKKARQGGEDKKTTPPPVFPMTMLFFSLEAPTGIEPGMKVLQTSALPLGYDAI